jgi:hypothetical protein
MVQNSTIKLYKENLKSQLRTELMACMLQECSQASRPVYMRPPPPRFDLPAPPSPIKFLQLTAAGANSPHFDKEKFLFYFLNTLNGNNLNTEEKCESVRAQLQATSNSKRPGFSNRMQTGNSNLKNGTRPLVNKSPATPLDTQKPAVLNELNKPVTVLSSQQPVGNFLFTPQFFLLASCFVFLLVVVLLVALFVIKRFVQKLKLKKDL